MVLYLPTVLFEIREVHQRFSTSPASRCLVPWWKKMGWGDWVVMLLEMFRPSSSGSTCLPWYRAGSDRDDDVRRSREWLEI